MMDKLTYKDYKNGKIEKKIKKLQKEVISMYKNNVIKFSINGIHMYGQVLFEMNSFTREVGYSKTNKILRINNDVENREFQQKFGKLGKNGLVEGDFIYWNMVYDAYNGIDLRYYNGGESGWMKLFIGRKKCLVWTKDNIDSIQVINNI